MKQKEFNLKKKKIKKRKLIKHFNFKIYFLYNYIK